MGHVLGSVWGEGKVVLLSPSLQTSACYYKSKLSSHNYTIYDKKSKEATSYDWNESRG